MTVKYCPIVIKSQCRKVVFIDETRSFSNNLRTNDHWKWLRSRQNKKIASAQSVKKRKKALNCDTTNRRKSLYSCFAIFCEKKAIAVVACFRFFLLSIQNGRVFDKVCTLLVGYSSSHFASFSTSPAPGPKCWSSAVTSATSFQSNRQSAQRVDTSCTALSNPSFTSAYLNTTITLNFWGETIQWSEKLQRTL
jgi:hypothetical protein